MSHLWSEPEPRTYNREEHMRELVNELSQLDRRLNVLRRKLFSIPVKYALLQPGELTRKIIPNEERDRIEGK